jgi:hypothetical protein
VTASGNTPLAILLAILGIVCLVFAFLYAMGDINLFASVPGHHYKHAVAGVVAAVVCFIGANYTRPHTV